MNTTNRSELYQTFLEAINKAQDLEALYSDSFQILYKLFSVNRVQLWEKISNVDEMSILYEYFEDREISMLKFRVPLLGNHLKRNLDKSNIWEFLNIKDGFLNKNNVNSLTGIEFIFPAQNKGLLVLTSHNNCKKFTDEEIVLLVKIKNCLQDAVFKIEKYQKSIDDLRRLQNQNNKLREQDRLRTNFINNISHELKTPLASIIGFSKIISTKNLPLETQKEIIDQINKAANRLSTLVSDFLQINKIDTEGWLAHLEPCDLGELIKNSIEEFSSLNKNHTISYFISDNYPIIKTDQKLVRQVLDNLISNAIKYSPNGGKVTISLQVSQDEKELKIIVSDQGIGISKEEIPNVFSRFFRSSNPEVQGISGSGLGLAICKEIITTLNGNMEVESEISKGSKFSFTLPVS